MNRVTIFVPGAKDVRLGTTTGALFFFVWFHCLAWLAHLQVTSGGISSSSSSSSSSRTSRERKRMRRRRRDDVGGTVAPSGRMIIIGFD